jgi:acyl carrier protein
MSGQELQRQTQFWVKKLTPLPPAIDLPLDHARPEQMSGRGGFYQFNLPGELTQTLRDQAQRKKRTLYVTLLAAYVLALHRWSRQQDFVVGTPVRGREQPELEPLMGFFVNMLPMPMHVDPTVRIEDWLAQVRDNVVESFSSPDVPFDHLVRQLKPPRDPSRPPLHQVTFSYQDVRERPTKWGSAEHQRFPTPMLGAAQELALWCVETKKHIEFVFTFTSDILETSSVQAFAQGLEAIVQQLAGDSSRTIGSLLAESTAPLTIAATSRTVESPREEAAQKPAAADSSSASAERAIAEVWGSLLGIDNIKTTDNFFDLGGHSLLAMQAIDEIELRLGVRINVRGLIFETLGQIAASLDKAPTAQVAEQPAVADEKPGFFKRLFGRGERDK